MIKVKLGLDMGGTSIKMALVQNNGLLLKKKSLPALSGIHMEERLNKMVDDINDMLGSEYDLQGIGIAFPGIVDFENGKILSQYVKYPDAHTSDLRGWAFKHWKVPLIIENDARAALIGEWQFGAGIGSKDLVMVTLGTGMGSAVLLNGQLLRGRNYLAGNLGGHMSIDFEGDQCNCGNVGCVETVGSTWALNKNILKIKNYKESSLIANKELSFKDVFEAAAESDSVAIELKKRSLEAWAAAVINLLHAYDPEKVIIGGGIMESKDEIIPFIEQRVKERSWLPTQIPIMAATQTKNAGILGVCSLLT